MNNSERLKQLNKFPDHAEDWDKIVEGIEKEIGKDSFPKANETIEVIYTGIKKAEVPEDLARDGNISPGAKALYIVYFTYTYKQEPGCFAGRKKLSEHLGVTLKTVTKWTQELESLGWITVKRGRKIIKVNGREGETDSNIVELHDKPER